MELYAHYRKDMEVEYTFYSGRKSDVVISVELSYSAFHVLSGNPEWYCRVWMHNRILSESFGKTKFEAFRKAYRNK